MTSGLLIGGGSVASGSIGFKFIPIIINDVSGGVVYHLSATQAMAGDDSVVQVVTNSASGTYSGAGHFYYAGFIVSTPFSFK